MLNGVSPVVVCMVVLIHLHTPRCLVVINKIEHSIGHSFAGLNIINDKNKQAEN